MDPAAERGVGNIVETDTPLCFQEKRSLCVLCKRLKKKKRDRLSYSTTVQPTDCSSANTQGGFLVDMVMARTALCRMRYFQGRKKKEILRICFSHVGFRKDCLWTVCVVMAVVPISLFTVSGHRVVGLPVKRQAGLKEDLFYFRCDIAPAL